jgi:hypothetical protein
VPRSPVRGVRRGPGFARTLCRLDDGGRDTVPGGSGLRLPHDAAVGIVSGGGGGSLLDARVRESRRPPVLEHVGKWHARLLRRDRGLHRCAGHGDLHAEPVWCLRLLFVPAHGGGNVGRLLHVADLTAPVSSKASSDRASRRGSRDDRDGRARLAPQSGRRVGRLIGEGRVYWCGARSMSPREKCRRHRRLPYSVRNWAGNSTTCRTV